MSEARKYRKFSASQKLELGLASLRGDRSVAEIRREHAISQTLLRRWREQLLEAGAERLAGAEQRSHQAELRKRIARARARARAQDLRAGDRGKALARWGVRPRVARSRELVAAGYKPTVVARVAQITRQAIYRTPKTRPPPVAQVRRPMKSSTGSWRSPTANPTDGYRRVRALVRRKLGRAVNRKRVLRVMRERKLIQRIASRSGAGRASSVSSVPASSGVSTRRSGSPSTAGST